MQELNLYEYAVIRALPKVEREEFLNVGLIMFCKKQKYIRASYSLDKKRLMAIFPEKQIEDLELNLKSLVNIADGLKNCSQIANLEIPERFRWLTAVRSSCIQTSRPHSGLSTNLNETFERLFQDMIL